MRGHLDSLGGGGRTAKALEAMEVPFYELKSTFKHGRLRARDCANAFSGLLSCTKEMAASLEEFSIFNAEFSESNNEMQITLQKYREILRTQNLLAPTEGYINDIVLQNVASTLERYLREVSSIAEKELAALHLSQDFTTSRYLNLTTVATFFSSVTATTLQTSFGNTQTNIGSITNCFWFISLSFSVASAIYSLLVMTWKQSSVRPPKKLKPAWLVTWLMRGPMFCLIVSSAAFSAGICLLAFEADQGLLTPLITTAFTMGHAWILLSFSCWFAFEQWKLHYHVPSFDLLTFAKCQYSVLSRKALLVWEGTTEYICAMLQHKPQTDMELAITSCPSSIKAESVATHPDHFTMHTGLTNARLELQSAIPIVLTAEADTEDSTMAHPISEELNARISMRCMQFSHEGQFIAFTGRNHMSCVVYGTLAAEAFLCSSTSKNCS
ncbi:hypothetical protein DFH11DRAFT_587736 [Phellopilus nigrolimitatus]|nr:hypothetical protein DFH11DRAFT_587736 [Phellopilus nigrolimitatus]